ncbi:MAG: DUF1015 domain-containing protein [Coriobacteriales bacterium]|nr:DUF1015 domain-containing protein [Coriobacteriales bacterium]
MARIEAFRGYRYASDDADISSLCAPPYDVLSQEQRDALEAGNAHNAVVLELAPGALDLETPRNRYVTAAATWEAWKRDGVLVRDEQPCIYLLEQCFEVEGAQHRRSVFICQVQVRPFADKVVLPHELTLPKALGDRYRLISTTHANFSSVFGLFNWNGDDYQHLIDGIKEGPVAACATDADGVVSRLWLVQDEALIHRIQEALDGECIFIADGHHRYTTAVAYRDAARQARYGTVDAQDLPGFDAEADSEYTLISLANMRDPQLVVLPYHRAVKAAGAFDAAAFLARMGGLFELEMGATQEDLDACERGRVAFLMKVAGMDGLVLARIKADVDLDAAITSEHSPAWKRVDYAALQELVLGPIFGIDPRDAGTLTRMAYSKRVEDLDARVASGESDVAFHMRPIMMEQLQDVSLSGETMPQKSTYFYPKLPSGMVYRGME